MRTGARSPGTPFTELVSRVRKACGCAPPRAIISKNISYLRRRTRLMSTRSRAWRSFPHGPPGRRRRPPLTASWCSCSPTALRRAAPASSLPRASVAARHAHGRRRQAPPHRGTPTSEPMRRSIRAGAIARRRWQAESWAAMVTRSPELVRDRSLALLDRLAEILSRQGDLEMADWTRREAESLRSLRPNVERRMARTGSRSKRACGRCSRACSRCAERWMSVRAWQR